MAGSTGDPQSLNRYTYANNLPTSLVDPSGLCDEMAVARRHRKKIRELSSGASRGLLDDEIDLAFGLQEGWDDSCYDLGGGGGASDPPLVDAGPAPDPCADTSGCTVVVTATPDPTDPTEGLPTVGDPTGPTLDDLLSQSVQRIQTDLTKPDCAKDFVDPKKKAQLAGNAKYSDLGQLKFKNVNGLAVATPDTGPLGNFDPNKQLLNLNTQVNWLSPNNTAATLDGRPYSYSAMNAMAASIAVPKVSRSQYMDLVVIHELAHYNGKVGTPDDPKVMKILWNDCIK